MELLKSGWSPGLNNTENPYQELGRGVGKGVLSALARKFLKIVFVLAFSLSDSFVSLFWDFILSQIQRGWINSPVSEKQLAWCCNWMHRLSENKVLSNLHDSFVGSGEVTSASI